MRSIVVSVDYGDILAVTLPRNARHFESVLVVSTPGDALTAGVVSTVPNAELFTTDAFYDNGAVFNKGRAMNLGLDHLGRWRDEWLVIWDADIVMPANLRELINGLPPGHLFSPRRRMLADPKAYRDDLNWREVPRKHDEECAGYFQLFHSRDPVLRDPDHPWYGEDWLTAGGCDSDFAARWSQRRRIKLPWFVLHLGEDNKNWCGRATPFMDGSLHPQARERAERLTEMMRVRHESGGRHEHEKLKEKL